MSEILRRVTAAGSVTTFFLASVKTLPDMPNRQFGPIVDLDYMTKGFAQFQMDKDGKLNLLRLSIEDGQAYEFRRE